MTKKQNTHGASPTPDVPDIPSNLRLRFHFKGVRLLPQIGRTRKRGQGGTLDPIGICVVEPVDVVSF